MTSLTYSTRGKTKEKMPAFPANLMIKPQAHELASLESALSIPIERFVRDLKGMTQSNQEQLIAACKRAGITDVKSFVTIIRDVQDARDKLPGFFGPRTEKLVLPALEEKGLRLGMGKLVVDEAIHFELATKKERV